VETVSIEEIWATGINQAGGLAQVPAEQNGAPIRLPALARFLTTRHRRCELVRLTLALR
jgi:hypothetical protein